MITDYRKQEELMVEGLLECPIHIIGAGALGSWLAFFALKMGFTDVNVYDFDKIEEHNLPNQNYKEADIGENKVIALKHLYEDFFYDGSDFRLKANIQKVTKPMAKKMEGIVFC